MDKITVLYICTDPGLGGSTVSLYYLIESVKDKVYPIVLFPERGIGYDFFVQQEIESIVFPFVRLHEFKSNNLFDVWRHSSNWHYIKKKRLDRDCYRLVKKYLSGRKLDIIHSNTSPNDIGVYLSKKFNVVHVWHVREFCDLHFNYNIYRGISRLRRLINHANARIAISSAIKKHWNMVDNNTWVINDAIGGKEDACYLLEKERYLLFCSYFLTEAKGARIAIKAFGISVLYEEGYHLKMVGNCEDCYRQSLLETAKEYGCEEYVDFVPYQTDMKPFFKNAKAFIMASKCEGLGRVTAEAMLYGCPVVAHASGGTLDLVKNGTTGWLFNTEEDCAKMIRIVCHESQNCIIMNAQHFVLNNLTIEVYGPKIINVYHHVLYR